MQKQMPKLHERIQKKMSRLHERMQKNIQDGLWTCFGLHFVLF
jgi:hypothetical protein